MGVTFIQTKAECGNCGRETSVRHSGWRWLCTACWPLVFDGSKPPDYERSMGPGHAER